jgi:peptide chain release factor 2
LKLEGAKQEISVLETESSREEFWNDIQNSRKVLQRIKQLKSKIEKFNDLSRRWDDLMAICEMALEEGADSLLEDLRNEYDSFEQALEEAMLSTLLSGEYDDLGAIISFHAGAGGTEAQDWAQMLYRMYTRWASGTVTNTSYSTILTARRPG